MRDQVKDIAEYLADKCIFTATENSSYELKEKTWIVINFIRIIKTS